MPNTIKCRRVAALPGVTYFKPAGIPLRLLEETCISVEEAEAIRLRDIEELSQEQCAAQMRISRSTFQRVLKSARRKVSDALLNGKAMKIDGGNFEVSMQPNSLHQGRVKEKSCLFTNTNAENAEPSRNS